MARRAPTTTTRRRRDAPLTTPRSVADLVQDPHNRRLHPERNLASIGASLQAIGAARSIVIDERNTILAGNGVVSSAPGAGISKLKVIDVDGDTIVAVRRRGLTPEQKRLLAMYDNRTGELAEWDVAQLAADLRDGLDLSAFFDAAELSQLKLGGPAQTDGLTDPELVPPVRATAIQPGDLFACGRHRLLCGDSGQAADVARLLEGARADALFTSPPYNVGVEYVDHDDAQAPAVYLAWLASLVETWLPHVAPGRAVIWNIGASAKCAPYRHASMLEAAGLTFVRQFVWRKVGVSVPLFYHTLENPCVRHLTSNFSHEMIYVLATGRELIQGPPQACDDILKDDVFTVSQTNATRDLPPGPTRTGAKSHLDRRALKAHPATFPVHLVTTFLQHYAGPDELVVDPFAGAGSTMMACERLGLVARGIEIAPQYCQVAIDRWEAFTGQTATRIARAPAKPKPTPARRRKAR